MREIKFRAWDKTQKSMTTDITFKFIKEAFDKYMLNEGLKAIIKEEVLELMQYTGLKDKNGKEIYEGDIVKVCNHLREEPKELIREVFFQDGFFGIIDEYDKEDWLCAWDIKEVIGNKFENPELLEEIRGLKS